MTSSLNTLQNPTTHSGAHDFRVHQGVSIASHADYANKLCQTSSLHTKTRIHRVQGMTGRTAAETSKHKILAGP